MKARFVLPALLLGSAVQVAGAQNAPPPLFTPSSAPRAVRRDLPLTNMIRRAWAAGTRDSTGRPGRNYWQLWNDYTIDAKFDAPTSTVSGREQIVVHNNSDSAMRTIVLRLDQNIYTANVPRAETVPEITDGMVVTKLAINGASVDVSDRSNSAGRSPRGTVAPPLTVPKATGITQTVATIQLPTPVAPKGTATIDAEWHFRVPLVNGVRGLRMGRWGDSLYQPTQWYPRVAMYDDLRGWDTEPYLGPSEFYNNFGRFDVQHRRAGRLDRQRHGRAAEPGAGAHRDGARAAVARARVRSTRTIVERERGRRRASRPRRATVSSGTSSPTRSNDFAWATAERFVWDATRATIPGKGAIPVNMVYVPGHAQAYAPTPARRAACARVLLEAVDAVPVSALTLQDGPSAAWNTRWSSSRTGRRRSRDRSPVVADDGRHQRDVVRLDGRGIQPVHEHPLAIRPARAARQRPRQPRPALRPHERRRARGADDVGRELRRTARTRFQTYGKTPLMLSMLGGIVGDTAVQRAMSEYAKTWSFKHPSPWDYMFFMNNALKQDLALVLVLLAVHDRVGGRLDRERDDTSGHRTTVTVRAGRPDAVAGRAEGAVRGDGPGDQADGQRAHGRRDDRDRHLAGRRLVRRKPHVRRRSRLRRARDRIRSRSIRAAASPTAIRATTCGRGSSGLQQNVRGAEIRTGFRPALLQVAVELCKRSA